MVRFEFGLDPDFPIPTATSKVIKKWSKNNHLTSFNLSQDWSTHKGELGIFKHKIGDLILAGLLCLRKKICWWIHNLRHILKQP